MRESVLRRAVAAVYGVPDVPGELIALGGHASSRSYYRFVAAGREPRSLILMVLPPDAPASDEGGAAGNALELPFLDVQRFMAAKGLPVPAVHAADRSQGLVLLEDLGDETFEKRFLRSGSEARSRQYEQAVDLLVEMQVRCAATDSGACMAFGRGFDQELLRWELDHFREWGLCALGDPLTEAEQAVIERAFSQLVSDLLAMPQVFVHRDYQSRNLMWDGAGQLRLIDFQDALLGPRCYDLAALLCDSYVALDLDFQTRLVRRFAAAIGKDPAAVETAFWKVAVHRKLKDAGRFVFIDRVRGNPAFLRHYPQSIAYVDRALDKLGMEPLQALLRRRLAGYPGAVPIPPSVDTSRGGKVVGRG